MGGFELKYFLLFIHLIGMILMQFVVGDPQVPCYFIFGDSLFDNGNNNGLVTAAKANYDPYGIDFPQGATGRFTNGRTTADIISQLLGFDEFIPPYTTANDQQIINGVNYASGGAGIRDESGIQLGERISLNRQLLNHGTTIARLLRIQQNLSFTNEHLMKCIYTVNMGSNDYINNYFMPDRYTTSRVYTTDHYAEVLIRQYSLQLKTLYNLGARKIAVFGLGQIGCTPAEIAIFGTNGSPCVEKINDAVNLFNDKIKPLVDKLNNDLRDAKFTFINITSITSPDPSQGGVSVPNVPCCQVRADGQCIPNTVPCPNRDLSVFYDGFHPTEIANIFVASRSYTALSPMDASPVDISHLALL